MFKQVRLPSLGGGTEWLNSERLGPAELRGHVVPSHGADVDEDGNGLLEDGRLYQLVRQYDTVRERTVQITFLDAGAEAHAFTLG